MKIILNIISLTASFSVAFMVLYFVQYYTIGMIPRFKNLVLGRFFVKDLVFTIIALVLIHRFLKFYLPF